MSLPVQAAATKSPAAAAMLTVAIPTYNRNSLLLQTVQVLAPQLTVVCKLLIIDNCSDTPVAETLRELLAQYPDLNYSIIRNHTNIGLTANLLRCFEFCTTEWLWAIGDDDQLNPDAISLIFQYISRHPTAMLFNFPVDRPRKQERLTTGLAQLISGIDGMADLGFVASSVFKASKLLPNLRYGYHYATTYHPHIVMLLMTIGDADVCCLANQQICRREMEEIPVEQQWSLINLVLGFPTIMDLPLNSAVRENLGRKLVSRDGKDAVNLRVLAYQILLQAVKQHDPRAARYYFDQVRARWYYFDRRPLRRLELLFYTLLVRYPPLTMRLFQLIRRRPIREHNLQDRFSRM